ncbi:MAG: hypothetical protein AAFR58_09670, partial [Cyanobacteria bacterium J06627_28]
FISVMAGMALILLCHAVYAAVVLFTPLLLAWLNLYPDNEPYFFINVWVIGFTGMGILQLLYVVPFYLFFKRRQKIEISKGTAIMAGITLLLNGACFLSFFGLG